MGSQAYRCGTTLLLLLSLAAPTAMGAKALEKLDLIDYSEVEGNFYSPIALVALGDSLMAVVNQGDGSIVVLDSNWTVVRRFGQLGEAPGELVSPQDAFAWGDTLWVQSSSRLDGFTVAGEYVGSRTLPVGTTSISQNDRGLFGTWVGGVDGVGVGFLLSDTGDIVSTFGPSCGAQAPDDDGDFAECIGWTVLPQSDGDYVLFNFYRGEVVMSAGTPSERRKSLGIGTPEVIRRGSYKWVANSVCQDPSGGYWVLGFQVEGVAHVYRFDDSWNLVGERAVPPGPGQGGINVLSDGSLGLLETVASRLWIFKRPSFSSN